MRSSLPYSLCMVLLTIGVSFNAHGQTPCIGFATDPGGASADYPNDTVVTTTYCSEKVGDVVTLTFSEFDVDNSDYLAIYDGPSSTSPLIGYFSGDLDLSTFTATYDEVNNPTGCLTLVFSSGQEFNQAGYVAKITCGPAPPANPLGTPCGDFVNDPGGSLNYPNNLGGNSSSPRWTAAYCPQGDGNVVTLHFLQFDVESNYDKLYIYYGSSDADAIPANLISSGNGPGAPDVNGPGGWWGNYIPDISGSLTNGDGCLYLVFYTDASVTMAGWRAEVICEPPPPPPIPGTTCGTTFFDAGGTAFYPDNLDETTTICAPAGEAVVLDFYQFSVQGYDRVFIYDGPTIASPQIASDNDAGYGPAAIFGPGGYWGTGSRGPFVSTGNCLTVRFISDSLYGAMGWQASINCAPHPSNENPCSLAGTIEIPISPSCSFTTADNSFAADTSEIAAPDCGNYQGADLWYSFVAPTDGQVLITTQEGTLTDAGMALYEATTCTGPFTLLECDDDDGPGTMPEIDRRCNPLSSGATYYIRLWGFSGSRGDFGICVTQGYAGIEQGDCLGANLICNGDPIASEPSNPGCVNDLSDVNWGCLSGGEEIGSWYAFQAHDQGTLGMTITPAGAEDLDWAIWGPFPTGSQLTDLCPLTPEAGAPKRCSYTSSTLTNAATGAYATGMGGPFGSGVGPVDTPESDINENGWTSGFSNVNSGEIYLLYVNDHHHSADSYTITWQLDTPEMLDCVTLTVNDIEFQNSTLIVPNPTNGLTELVFSQAQKEVLLIRVTDSSGRLVGELRSAIGLKRVILPTENLDQGTYFVSSQTLDGTLGGVTRFVKQ